MASTPLYIVISFKTGARGMLQAVQPLQQFKTPERAKKAAEGNVGRYAGSAVIEQLPVEFAPPTLLASFGRLPNRPATFLFRVAGDSMIDKGLFDGDLAVVDRSLKPQAGDIVVSVFYHTNEHDVGRPQRSVATTVELPEASNDTLALAKAATLGLRRTWRSGFRYSKAGVITVDLVPLANSQRALPSIGRLDREKGAALMSAVDECNRRFGHGTVVPGPAGVMPARPGWTTQFEMRSPRYTTRLAELPVVQAT